MDSIGSRIFNWMFGCRHKELTRVFTIDHQTYRVCLACGAKIPYSEEDLTRTRPAQAAVHPRHS